MDGSWETTYRTTQWRKRRVYAFLLPGAGVAAVVLVAVAAVTRGVPWAFAACILTFGIGMAGLTVALRSRSVPLRHIELGLLGIASVTALASAACDLYWQPFGAAAGLGALAVVLWLPLIQVLAFLMLADRSALRFSFALMTALAAIVLPFVAGDGGEGALLSRGLLTLQAAAADGALVMALYVLSGFQRRLRTVEATAHAMQELANTDALTGVPNRRRVEQTLQLEMRRSQRYGRALSVVLLDLDDFKTLNDVHGHALGDEVLMALAERLTQALRSSDTFGRWGGEEFLVVAPETALEGAVTLAEAMRTRMRQAPLVAGHDVRASFGVAEYLPGEPVTDLLRRADDALYLAKRSGKDRVRSSDQVTPTKS